MPLRGYSNVVGNEVPRFCPMLGFERDPQPTVFTWGLSR